MQWLERPHTVRHERVCRRNCCDQASHRVADEEKRGSVAVLCVAFFQHEHGARHEQHLAVEQAACGRPASKQAESLLSGTAHRPGRKVPPENQRCTNPAPGCDPGKRRCAVSLPLRQASEPCRQAVRRRAQKAERRYLATHLLVAATAAWNEEHGHAGERRLVAHAWNRLPLVQAQCMSKVRAGIPSPNASWYAYRAYGPTSLLRA